MAKSGTTLGQYDMWLAFGSGYPKLRCTPSTGIWWPGAVLCQVTLTFGEPLGQAALQSDLPPVEASGGQAWYEDRPSRPELRYTPK